MWGYRVVTRTSETRSDGIYTVFLSAREYMKYEVQAARVEPHGSMHEQTSPWWSRDEKSLTSLTLFIDCETGVAVVDVAEYEKSLGLSPSEENRYRYPEGVTT